MVSGPAKPDSYSSLSQLLSDGQLVKRRENICKSNITAQHLQDVHDNSTWEALSKLCMVTSGDKRLSLNDRESP